MKVFICFSKRRFPLVSFAVDDTEIGGTSCEDPVGRLGRSSGLTASLLTATIFSSSKCGKGLSSLVISWSIRCM